MQERGFYVISDEFFKDFPDPYLKGNKEEHRPHYYALRDERTGLYWMIPMSSQIEKYTNIINKRISRNKPCDILHIAKLDNGKTSVFLIQDIFPVSDKYISRKYTIAENHLKITSERLAKIIEQKARKTLGMIRRGIKFTPTQPDVLFIEEKLLNNNSVDSFIKGLKFKE
ncbi:MAG: type III toxin-antitoxin system CptIN family toxin [Acutalibacteraceae bacterium]